MDIDKITKVVATLGFPTVACIAMGWFIVTVLSKNTAAITALTTAVNNM